MKNFRIIAVAFVFALTFSACVKSPSSKSGRTPASTSSEGTTRSIWWMKSTKQTWKFDYDSKRPIRMANWVNYLNLPFDASAPNPFAGLDSNVTSIDYGFFNPQLGGGHIARAAQHALTYGNYVVGRQCLEEAVKDYMVANNITSSPDKFIYDQGFWPMRSSGIAAGDSQITKISKALKSLHGGDLVYSKLQSTGPENGAEVVTLNCTTCHESRALIPTCAAPGCATSGNYKAVRNPWGTEGYISKNLKLMGQAVQDAVAKAASGSACASGPEKHIMAALYEIQKAKHVSSAGTVDMDPRRILALTPDSSFYNPSGALAHTVLNLLVNEDSWVNKKPANVDQAYQMFRPEEVLNNEQFFPILNANFNNFFGINRNGTPGPVNFSLNSAWGQKFNFPTDNFFHGMGCSFTRPSDGKEIIIPCDITEKAIALAATTNSQAENPDLSSDTLSRFPGVSADYKWPLRQYSGPDGVFQRTSELFVGLDSNTANYAVSDLTNGRAMTIETVQRGMDTYNQRCANCHGQAGMEPGANNTFILNPGKTDIRKFVDTLRDVPATAYIANLRQQPYVQEDAPRDLVIAEFDGYRGRLSYGAMQNSRKALVKNLVGVALEQRFGCYLSLTEFLNRSAPKAIQVTSSVLDVQNLGYVKKAQYVHTAANEAAAAAGNPRHLIYWHKEHPECGPLTADGLTQPSQFYDAPFHGGIAALDGVSGPKLTSTESKELIDFLVAISFDKTVLPFYAGDTSAPKTIRLAAPNRQLYNNYMTGFQSTLSPSGVLDGNSCRPRGAKYAEACNPALENNKENPGRACHGDHDTAMGFHTDMTLRCSPQSNTWVFCESHDDCVVGQFANNSCIAGRCVVPTCSPIHPSNDPTNTVVQERMSREIDPWGNTIFYGSGTESSIYLDGEPGDPYDTPGICGETGGTSSGSTTSGEGAPSGEPTDGGSSDPYGDGGYTDPYDGGYTDPYGDGGYSDPYGDGGYSDPYGGYDPGYYE